MEEANHATLSFACDFDERTAWEVRQKGWFEQAIVHLPDGNKVPVCFWDPGRLSQDLETDLKLGKTCISEPGMIVIPEVTAENMKAAVEELYHRGYFNQLRSLFQ
jgi:hypothetical protein